MSESLERSQPLIDQIQHVHQITHGIVSPSNVLDVIAIAVAAWAGPRLNTLLGYGAAAGAYGTDGIDGWVARRTGTTGKVGYYLDHVVGDKPKTLYALYHIWHLGLADNTVIAAAGAYNLATTAITAYDRVVNKESQLDVSLKAKRAFAGTSMALGIQNGASLLADKRPELAEKARLAGLALSIGSLVIFGIPAIEQYAEQARSGTKRDWIERLLNRQ